MNQREYLLFGILDLLLRGADRPTTVGELARDLGVRVTEVGEGLLHLEARSLVNASTIRLTLSGLCAARALAAQAAATTVAAA